MELSRERFIDQFAISIQVEITRTWNITRKEPLTYFGRTIYETIRTTAGQLSVTGPAFSAIVEPVIVEVHSRLPRRKRPDAKELASLVYDALDNAGVEVTIEPPTRAHGGRSSCRQR